MKYLLLSVRSFLSNRGVIIGVIIGVIVLLLVGASWFGFYGGQDGGATPTVRFEKQSLTGQTVTVQSVYLPHDGYVAIHNTEQATGVGRVIGVSDYLTAGTHKNVQVSLFGIPSRNFSGTTLQESQTMVAVPHRETTGNQTFDFVSTEGREDVPYTVNDQPITDTAFIVVSSKANRTANAMTKRERSGQY
jgi:hypothetical protein